jgi:DNA-binding response OmpR family regulator
MRRMLGDFLRAEGFAVDQAADGAEALQRVANEDGRYHGLVLDNNMPGATGLDLLPRLRGLAPGTPVILVTSLGDERTLQEAFARGAYDILLKPFSLDDLLDVLGRASRDAGAPPKAGLAERMED